MKIKRSISVVETRGTRLPSPDDEAEISRLYLMYRDPFTAFITKYFGCDEAAVADIYQESFIAMFENLRNGRISGQSASLRTYLFQIGRFKAMNLHRQRRGHPMVNIDDLCNCVETPPKARHGLNQIACEEVAAMQEPCSSILSFYYWECLDMAEIARRMNYKNERIAVNRKSLCLKKLRERIAVRMKKEGLNYYDSE